MLGLFLMGVAAAWVALGYLILDRVLEPMFANTRAAIRIPLFIVLACVWVIGPWIDEVLADRAFAEACAEIPQVKFHGPVAIGEGAYFDGQGNPKWRTSEEFYQIRRTTKEWNNAFGHRDERIKIQQWPAPILQIHSTYFAKSTNRPVIETYHRISPGGWIKRNVASGVFGMYQCISKGYFPKDEETIAFR
jgi:hypothetical protein